ncbi:MAG: hypothetical protein DMG40_14945 [Acidobacteria bacterium]|nr:MAG: hypothetical protein DMG40_14945 [Acidobacteriota bacterium]
MVGVVGIEHDPQTTKSRGMKALAVRQIQLLILLTEPLWPSGPLPLAAFELPPEEVERANRSAVWL